jgi:hypothetical protein
MKETAYKKTSHANVGFYGVTIREGWEPERNRIVELYHEGIFYSMVRVRERTIPTERPPLVGEVIANFCG